MESKKEQLFSPDELLGEKTIFLFGLGRSGTTLLQLMMQGHSKITSAQEHFLTVPIKYLGYFAQPYRAPYPIPFCSIGIKEFVKALPNEEEDYLDALRAYVITLYNKSRSTSDSAEFFLDKSGFEHWEFLCKLFPRAKYVVITRHPLGILDSMASTFNAGDYQTCIETGEIQTQIPPLAEFLRDSNVEKFHVDYDELVSDSRGMAEKLMSFLGLPFEEGVIDYGSSVKKGERLGDPIQAYSQTKPVKTSMDRWKKGVGASGKNKTIATQLIKMLSTEDLKTLGYDRGQILSQVAEIQAEDSKAGIKIEKRLFRVRPVVFSILRRLTKKSWFRNFITSMQYYLYLLVDAESINEKRGADGA